MPAAANDQDSYSHARAVVNHLRVAGGRRAGQVFRVFSVFIYHLIEYIFLGLIQLGLIFRLQDGSHCQSTLSLA